MDISKLNTAALSEGGVDMEFKHPVTGAGIGAFVKLRGPDSKAYRQARDEFLREAATKKIENPMERAEKMAMATRVACTVGFINLTIDGEEVTDAEKLYSDPGYAWIVEQVDRFIQDRSNFFPKA